MRKMNPTESKGSVYKILLIRILSNLAYPTLPLNIRKMLGKSWLFYSLFIDSDIWLRMRQVGRKVKMMLLDAPLTKKRTIKQHTKVRTNDWVTMNDEEFRMEAYIEILLTRDCQGKILHNRLTHWRKIKILTAWTFVRWGEIPIR